jgi:hypothetical protein
MGKDKRDRTTPKHPTVNRLVLGPKQRAAYQRMVAEKLEQAAQVDKAAKNIDRALAIRDGLIPPPWAEKLLKPASTKSKTRKANSERPEGPKEGPINLIARRFWPPDGKPPASVTDPEIVKKVGDEYQKKHGRSVDRTTILRSRTIARLRRR